MSHLPVTDIEIIKHDIGFSNAVSDVSAEHITDLSLPEFVDIFKRGTVRGMICRDFIW